MADLSFGVVLTFIGMGIVFSILAVMVFSMNGLARAHDYLTREPVNHAVNMAKNSGGKSEPLGADSAETEEENMEEIIAVISIAIAACESEETPKVSMIRQLPRTMTGWGLAGRMKILERWDV